MKRKIGQLVTTKEPVYAWYSNYAGNPVCRFEPGDVGLIRSVNRGRVVVEFTKPGVHPGVNPHFPDGQDPWDTSLAVEQTKLVRIPDPDPDELRELVETMASMYERWSELIREPVKENFVYEDNWEKDRIQVLLKYYAYELSVWTGTYFKDYVFLTDNPDFIALREKLK